jgi:hypothetical protein
VLQDDPFLPWMFVTQCVVKLLECLKVTVDIDGLPLWQKLDQYAPMIPKNSYHFLMYWGVLFLVYFLEGNVM